MIGLMIPNASAESIYKSMNHGIQFQYPLGWNVQEPPKTHETSPDIIALGPQVSIIPDSLTITVSNTEGKTFDQLKTEKINRLQPVVNAGDLDLKYTGTDQVSGRDIFIIHAQGSIIKKSPDTFKPDEIVNIGFAEALIYDTPKYYTISISSDRLDQFDQQIENLEKAVYTFAILDDKQTSIAAEEGGGCLIATAAFGSEMAPQVQFL